MAENNNNEFFKQILLFNPEWDDDISKRKVIKWNTTKIFNLNNSKYW